jgi:tetratricopeptide (TPR) repeat protein
MRRLVPLLVVLPLLALGCRRPESSPDELQPVSANPDPSFEKPATPNEEPKPPAVANGAKVRQLAESAEAALKENDLRAAARSLEEALRLGDDAALRAKYDGLRMKVSEYDAKRQRAAELRKDPAQLEAAILALGDAQKAWDTPDVRREIEEFTRALLDLRDRVAVADFEVRSSAEEPKVGRTVAEILLPSLKKRFDLVECAQLAKAFEALNIQAGDLAGDLKARPELGDLLKARYLVFGSVTRFGGWIANARLVDLRTGLVIQTGKVTAVTSQGLFQELPKLGAQLLMSDQERLAFEQEQANKDPVVVAKVDENARIPPPPAKPAANVPNPAPVPPGMLNVPPVPLAGGLALPDLNLFPLQPPLFLGQGVLPLPVGPLDAVVRARLLLLAVDLGDQFFLMGRFADALREYQLAFTLAPGEPLVQVRLNNLAPFVAPVDPFALLPPSLPPRVVVFDFLTRGDPGVVPPGLGPWTADNLAPYFTSQFLVVDRGLAYWTMARLGLSLRDVAVDPSARFWLGRALNVRYFVFGALTQTGSFDATTRLVDAELNFRAGEARIHVSNPLELKLRLGELAQVTLMSPLDRARFEQGSQQFQQLLAQGHAFFEQNNFAQARAFYRRALELQPGNVEALFYLQRTREREMAAARGMPFAQWKGQAADLLDRESRRADLLKDASRQLALDRDQFQGRERDRRMARQEIDQKAAQQLTDFATKQLNAKQSTPKQRQQAVDALTAAGRLHKSKSVDDLIAKAMPGSAPAPLADPKTRQAADFNSWMAQGDDARFGNRFAVAVKSYQKALEVIPGEPRATKALEYSKHMRDGTSLSAKGKFKEAADAFGEARTLVASNKQVSAQASNALNKANFEHNMAEGNKALRKGQGATTKKGRDEALDQAVGFCNEALRVFRNHPDAVRGLQLAEQGKRQKGP